MSDSEPSSLNPYHPPQHSGDARWSSLDRQRAQWRVGWTILILVPPALLNWACLHTELPGEFSLRGGRFLASLGLVWIGFWVAVTWFAGLRLLDIIARLLHRWFGRGVSPQVWLECMYRSLWPLPFAAIGGGVLWCIWSLLFFGVDQIDRIVISNVLGFLAHVAGACVYGTIFFNWYQLVRRSQADSG